MPNKAIQRIGHKAGLSLIFVFYKSGQGWHMLKRLRNIARNIAHKFSISANHFAYLASYGASQYVKIDFCSGQIFPNEYNIERNRILIEQCKSNLLCLLTKKEVEEIESAILTVTFTSAGSKL